MKRLQNLASAVEQGSEVEPDGLRVQAAGPRDNQDSRVNRQNFLPDPHDLPLHAGGGASQRLPSLDRAVPRVQDPAPVEGADRPQHTSTWTTDPAPPPVQQRGNADTKRPQVAQEAQHAGTRTTVAQRAKRVGKMVGGVDAIRHEHGRKMQMQDAGEQTARILSKPADSRTCVELEQVAHHLQLAGVWEKLRFTADDAAKIEVCRLFQARTCQKGEFVFLQETITIQAITIEATL